MTVSQSDIDRREFLRRGGAAAAAGIAVLNGMGGSAPRSAEEPEEREPVVIPPDFGRDAYLERMSGARILMREIQGHGLFLTPGTDMRYMTGLTVGRSERLIALILPLEGDPVLICPAFEKDLIAASPAGIEDVLVWDEDEDPFDLVVKAFKKLGLQGKRKIAIGGTVWYDNLARLTKVLPELEITSAGRVVGLLRERKSESEVKVMRAAVRITEDAIASAQRQVREGIREEEVAGLIHTHFKSHGLRGGGLVQFGPRSAIPHNPTSDRALAANEMILIDFGVRIHGYWSDITRCAVFGKATDRMKVVHATLRRIQDQAIRTAQPGLSCAGLDHMSRSIMKGEGFRKFIRHRLGHGVGLDGHEPPYLSLNYPQALSIGNVITIEPGIYTPDDYGIRIEDMAEITQSGPSLMSTPPDKLLEI